MKALWALALIPTVALAYDVDVTFDPPTTWEDGSPLAQSEIIRYEVRHTVDGVDQPTLTVPNDVTGFSVMSQVRGNHCFVMFTLAMDVEAVWSDPSNQACVMVTRGKPGKPNNVKIP